MGLLDSGNEDPFGYGGTFGSLLYRSPLQDGLGRGFGSVFDNGAVPFSFAGPGSLNFSPSMNPAIQGMQTTPAPDTQPYEVPTQPGGGSSWLAADRQTTQDMPTAAHPSRTFGERLQDLWNDPPRNGFVWLLQSGGRAVRDSIDAAKVLDAMRYMPQPRTEEEASAWNDLHDRATSQLINSSAIAAMRFQPVVPGGISAAVANPFNRLTAALPLVAGVASTSQKPKVGADR